MSSETPEHQVRAAFDEDAVTVHQAYGERIAVPARRAGRPPTRCARPCARGTTERLARCFPSSGLIRCRTS